MVIKEADFFPPPEIPFEPCKTAQRTSEGLNHRLTPASHLGAFVAAHPEPGKQTCQVVPNLIQMFSAETPGRQELLDWIKPMGHVAQDPVSSDGQHQMLQRLDAI